MEIKILTLEEGVYNFIYKLSEKTLKESKKALEQIVDNPKVLLVLIKAAEGNFLSNRNVYYPANFDKKFSILPSRHPEQYLPSCFKLNETLDNIQLNEEDEKFFLKMFEVYLPAVDVPATSLFFRNFFKEYQIDEMLFKECMLSSNEFDFERPMDNAGESQNTIDFVQRMVECSLNLILPNFKEMQGKRRLPNSNYLKSDYLKDFENEVEYFRKFIVDIEPEQEIKDNVDSGFFDTYDFGGWMSKDTDKKR